MADEGLVTSLYTLFQLGQSEVVAGKWDYSVIVFLWVSAARRVSLEYEVMLMGVSGLLE